jgi:hypothetical protein
MFDFICVSQAEDAWFSHMLPVPSNPQAPLAESIIRARYGAVGGNEGGEGGREGSEREEEGREREEGGESSRFKCFFFLPVPLFSFKCHQNPNNQY